MPYNVSFGLEPPEPAEICKCKFCCDPICEGDDQVVFNGDHYHEDCFVEVAPEILLKKYGAVKSVAGGNDECED